MVERRGGPRQIDSLLPDVGGRAFRRFGFAHTALVQRWEEIVGEAFAGWSVPQSLRLPRDKRGGAVLTIGVEGPFALQMQHVAPEIIARANRVVGEGTVARLRFVQGGVPPRSEGADARRRPSPVPDEISSVQDALRVIAREMGRETT